MGFGKRLPQAWGPGALSSLRGPPGPAPGSGFTSTRRWQLADLARPWGRLGVLRGSRGRKRGWAAPQVGALDHQHGL